MARAIKLPSVSLEKFFQDSSQYTPILIVLLLVASFLLGALTTKISYLEKVGVAGTTSNNSPSTAQGQRSPNQPVPQGAKVDVKQGQLPPLGNKNAKVTIVEFTDFQCPFCKRFFDDALVSIKKEYIDTGKAKLAIRHFPLTAIHPNAFAAGEASECANEQGKFWEYHDLLFKDQTKWESQTGNDAKNTFISSAEGLGLNSGVFTSCLSSGKYKANVDKDLSDGQTAGVSGTPTFYINGQQLVGAQPLASFKTVIDQELSK